MKELSLEQKAKAYDEAKYIMEEYLKSGNAGVIAENTIKKAFPELKESDDEKIKNFISNELACLRATDEKGTVRYNELTEAIAWLEKQGNLMKALQISNAKIGELIEENYYLKEQLEKQRKNNMGISEATKQKLEDNLNKALEKETPESWNKFLDEQGEQKSTIEMITPEESLGIDSETYSKIVDECVYGEQKPIKEHNACEFCEDRYGCVSPCPMKLVEEQKPVVILKFRVGDTIKNKKTNKIFTISDYSLLYEYYHDINHYHEIKFSEQDDWELVEQNPAWGEEDERMCKAIIDNIQAICGEGYFVGNIDSGELIKWLKSLKERYVWKPSDEQMDALHYVTNFDYGGYKATLVSLYEQLKKLKE